MGNGADARVAKSCPLRVLFCSYHCLVDPSSGAAISARSLLELLGERGWHVRSFCGPVLDFERHQCAAQLLSDEGVSFTSRSSGSGRLRFSVLHYRHKGVSGGIFVPERPGKPWASQAEGEAFLKGFAGILAEYRPHVLLTYGGSDLTLAVMDLARQHGAKVVFWLRNFAYDDPRLFRPAHAVIVPSQCSATHYRRVLDLETTVLPSPLHWERIDCGSADERRYVTFVNPQPAKGVFVFASIAEQLGRRRPDIPILVVEGRSGVGWLDRTGVDLSGLRNLFRMQNTPDPRDFYRVTRVMLMPSLWRESFGRVAAESMINGIPVLGSRRGALPELLGDSGFLFDVPERYTPETRVAPTGDEVAPWVETLVRLWDDEAFYAESSRCSRTSAMRWRPEILVPHYESFFRGLLNYVGLACRYGTTAHVAARDSGKIVPCHITEKGKNDEAHFS